MGLHHSLAIAAIIGIGFIADLGGRELSLLAPAALQFLIDAGYWIVMYLVMGAIFGLMV